MSYRVRFHRWNTKTSSGLVSPIQFWSAVYPNDNFENCYQWAEAMARGMRAVDPDSEFQIVEIANDSITSPRLSETEVVPGTLFEVNPDDE